LERFHTEALLQDVSATILIQINQQQLTHIIFLYKRNKVIGRHKNPEYNTKPKDQCFVAAKAAVIVLA
jgi:hypothetical protein